MPKFRNLFGRVFLVVMVATGAHAEEPSWDVISAQTFAIRPHGWYSSFDPDWGPEDEIDTAGIWRFEPSSGTYTRLRPFYFNARSGDVFDSYGLSGEGSYLSTIEDHLLFESWPVYLEFEVDSMRVVRRYPGLNDDVYPPGWVVQGPAIGEELAEELGLEPGVYGTARCLWPVTSFSPWTGWGPPCEPYAFPGYETPDDSGDRGVLLHRPLSPDRGQLTFSGLIPAETGVSYLPGHFYQDLSVDPARHGFWKATEREVFFIPIVDGELSGSWESYPLTEFPFDNTQREIHHLYYHPVQDLFIATTFDNDEAFSDRLRIFDKSFVQVAEYGAELVPLTVTSFPSEPPSTLVQTVPVVAKTRGREGTVWTSDLWLYNPSSSPLIVHVRRVTSPDSGIDVELPAHGSAEIDDVLGEMGGGTDGDGTQHDALVLTSPRRWGAELVAVSRAWTPSRGDHGSRRAAGSVGHAVPAVPGRVGYSNHLSYSFDEDFSHHTPVSLHTSLLNLDSRQPGRFRHNIGIVNDSEDDLTIRLLWGYAGLNRGIVYEPSEMGLERSLTVPPHSVTIRNVEDLFPAEIREAWPPRIGVVGERAASIWLSMVDNLSGDATFVPFTVYPMAVGYDSRLSVPVVGHLPGSEGTFWRTDLYGLLLGDGYWVRGEYDTTRGWFQPSEPGTDCGGAAQSGEITTMLDGEVGIPLEAWKQNYAELLGGSPEAMSDSYAETDWRSVFPDVVHLFEECAGDDDVRGALELQLGSWMSAYSRTYTTAPDGGTYGSMLPLYPVDGWPVQHFAGVEVSDRFRVNVGLYNGDAEHAIVHRLSLYSARGTVVAERELSLEPKASVLEPLEEILGVSPGSLPDGTYGLTVLPLDDEASGVQGRSWAYVSLVDDVSGDPTNWW